ncbi:MAG: glycolate oxidase subunit GlcF, partial [Parvibaculaceae bacterium]
MKTAFTAERLEDPKIAEANQILRTCVHCGFCTATCPTYVLLGDELDSPRGRIYLIKGMLERNEPATADVVKHIDRCLSCLSCMTTCPSGVHYMHLIDQARAHVEETYRRPLPDRLIRRVLGWVIPEPSRFRAALSLAKLGRPLAPLLDRMAWARPLAAMLRMAPATAPAGATLSTGVNPAEGAQRGRVALLKGCVQDTLQPSINTATVRLLTRHGIEVVMSEEAGCCGAITHHMGQEQDALARARANVDAWTAEIGKGGLDAIVINASGCGTTVKDYGHMLRLDPNYAEKAARVSALAKDISEYLAGLGLDRAKAPRAMRLAYHSACSLQHGQKVKTEPMALLATAGFEVLTVPEGHLCCGSAGTYNLLQPEIATKLRDRKVGNIERTGAEAVA